MRWLELAVQADGEAVEAVSEVLRRVAPGGVAVEEAVEPGDEGGYERRQQASVWVRAYLPIDGTEAARRREVEEALWHLNAIWPVGLLRVAEVAEEDWANAWKAHYRPLRVGSRFLVRPLWLEASPGPHDVVLDLDPGMAFGTGLHPTTQMCLEELEALPVEGRRVLDLGTGSGILAIAAAKLGAAEVLALDVDSVAVDAARRNVSANGVGRAVEVQRGTLPLATPRRFDLILANIIARVIVELAHELAATLEPGGTLVASGIIADRVEQALAALRAAGFELRVGDADGGSENGLVAHRFFVGPEAIDRGTVTFSGAQARQMSTVLRMRPGDRCFVLDNSGWQYEVEIASLTPNTVLAAVRSRSLVTTEPRTKITVYQGMLRANRFEFVLQKGTELGVVAFVPMICDRCVVGAVGDGRSARFERWERIVVEAAEQSGRGRLPALQPAVLFQQACESARGISLIPWEEETSSRLRDVLRRLVSEHPPGRPPSRARPFSVNIFVGPEGGFSESEIDRARDYGIAPVTLGPRILRAETAALAAATAVLYELGDLG